MLANESGTRSGEDFEALHDMRVASRRMRSAFAVFEDHFPRKNLLRVRKSLRRLTKALCAPREWDVHAEHLAELLGGLKREADMAAIEFVAELVDRRRAAERRRMVCRLDRIDVGLLASRARKLMKRMRRPRSSAREAWAALEPRAKLALGKLPALAETEKPDELHAMRVNVKRLRYALELFRPAFREPPTELLEMARRIQDVLGRHHDFVLLERLLVQTLAWLSQNGRRTLADGLLTPLERVRAEIRSQYREFVTIAGGVTAETVLETIRNCLQGRE